MNREPQDPGIRRHLFDNDSCIPNNPELPLLVYPDALPASSDLPSGCEALSRENRWEVAWRDGIFPYHHYHRIVHEVLGIIRGSARLTCAGESGVAVKAETEDVAVILTGVGRCN
jgi:uncharacterized protein YjlB